MPGLPATGTLSYNGYEFDAASHVEVRVQFLYDDANRTIVAHKHIITVQAVVTDDGGLDSDLLSIRQKLGESGKPLTFISRGFGDDLKITEKGLKRDVMSGPNPLELAWNPLGDDKSAEITWQIEVVAAVCAKGDRSLGIMALNYGVSFSYDSHGDTTRTIKGYIQIAQQMNLTPTDTADRYREHFYAAPLHGFKREHTWDVSLAKHRVEFTIVDRQIPSPNPFPPGIVDISANHRVSWRRASGSARYFNTISARITPEARLSGAQAWQAFLAIVLGRIAWAKRRGRSVFLESIDVDESIFSRTHTFSVTYRTLSSIKDFVGDSGLWRNVGTDWNNWIISLQGSMFNQRGNAQLQDIAQNDVLVSLCESPGTSVSYNNLQGFETVLTPVPPRTATRTVLKNDPPSPGESWMEFESTIVPQREAPVVRQGILQEVEELAPGWLLEQELDNLPPEFFEAPKRNPAPDILQQSGAGRYSIWIVGRGVRAGHKIPRPAILQVGNRPAVESWGIFPNGVVGNYFGVPVYWAQWAIQYYLDRAPGRVLPMADLAERVKPQADTIEQPSPGTTA